jgi:hypothetical protein
MITFPLQIVVAAALLLPAGAHDRTVPVSGGGFDSLNTAIVHEKHDTPTGSMQKSTETVELNGDLIGRVLYQVTTVIDTAHGTLVNTGDSVFSGTIAGSAPVLILDDRSRFDVNLVTGQERGQVTLAHALAGPKVRCTLDVVGTGLNADGNPTFTYTGQCTFRGE